jgi:hypothetical protein
MQPSSCPIRFSVLPSQLVPVTSENKWHSKSAEFYLYFGINKIVSDTSYSGFTSTGFTTNTVSPLNLTYTPPSLSLPSVKMLRCVSPHWSDLFYYWCAYTAKETPIPDPSQSSPNDFISLPDYRSFGEINFHTIFLVLRSR